MLVFEVLECVVVDFDFGVEGFVLVVDVDFIDVVDGFYEVVVEVEIVDEIFDVFG